MKAPTIGAEDGRKRVIIEGVTPEIDRGRSPIKRIVGERAVVEADMSPDSHDALTCVLLYRRQSETKWNESPMTFIVNDRWRGDFTVTELGQYLHTVEAWTGRFKSCWRRLVVVVGREKARFNTLGEGP